MDLWLNPHFCLDLQQGNMLKKSMLNERLFAYLTPHIFAGFTMQDALFHVIDDTLLIYVWETI